MSAKKIKNPDNAESIRTILKNLPEEIKELARCCKPSHLAAANNYLNGYTKLQACVSAKCFEYDHTSLGRMCNLANGVLDRGEVVEYMSAVKDYHCSETIMTLHEIDMRLTKIARTEKTEVVRYTSEPVYAEDKETGEQVVIGYRTVPYMVPLEQLNERQRQAIKSIKKTKNGLEVEMHDQVKAMDMLIKRKGGYTENVNNNVTSEGKQIHAFIPSNGRGPDNDNE